MFINNIIKTLTDNLFSSIISLIVVFLIVYYATIILSKEFSILWDKLKLSPWIKWATFDVIWGSIPELFSVLVAIIILWKKWLEVWIWTIWWSIIFNVLIIPFFAIIFYKKNKIKKFSIDNIKRDVIFFIISILILFFWVNNNLYFFTSILLIIIYWIYLYFLSIKNKEYILEHKHRVKEHYKSAKNEKIAFFKIIISLIILYFWTELSVNSIIFLSDYFWISNFISSLILLAAITSYPNLLFWIKAAKNWRIDSSFWDSVWSNIFDVCIWLWIPILIGILIWIDFTNSFFIDYHILIFMIFSSLVFLFLVYKEKIFKKDWYILLIMYFIFMFYVLYQK